MSAELITKYKSIKIELLESQFVKLSFTGEEEYSVEDMDIVINSVTKFLNYRKFVCLTDLTHYFGTFPISVMKYLANHPDLKKYKYREAFIIKKLGIRIQAHNYFNLILKLNSRIYIKERAAKKWLLKKKKKINSN